MKISAKKTQNTRKNPTTPSHKLGESISNKIIDKELYLEHIKNSCNSIERKDKQPKKIHRRLEQQRHKEDVKIANEDVLNIFSSQENAN